MAKNVLIIGNDPDIVNRFDSAALLVKKIKSYAKKYDMNTTLAYFENITVSIDENGVVMCDKLTGKELKSFDLVFFRNWVSNGERAKAIAHYLYHNKVKFVNSEVLNYRSHSKLSQYVIMAYAGLRVPKSFFGSGKHIVEFMASEKRSFNYPIIIKDIYGRRGSHNHLAKNDNEVLKVTSANPEIKFIAQEFIPNTFDYRVLVFDKKVELVMKRARLNDDTHLNNTSQGAKASLVETSVLSPNDQESAIVAAKLFSREITGVDFVVNTDTGEHIILEVNNLPQLETGQFVDEKLESLTKVLASM